MPRAPPGLSLLLMAALAFATHHHPPSSQQQTPPLETINPWLSACDLQPASATDLKGACSAMWGPGPRCPPPCTQYNSTTQCLFYMNDSHKEKVCGRGFSPERRRDELKKLRMRHCCEHTAISALPERVLQGGQDCLHLLDGLLEVDALAARLTCEFAGILYRYDCTQKYSIKHRCEDCKEAYRRWLCSSLVPHMTETGQRVRPCLSVCQSVEQKCPYMLPGDRAPAYPTQYAGEPTFLCLDPNIPETGAQRKKSSTGDEDCCYSHCGTPGRGVGGCEGPNIIVNCPAGRPATNDTPEPVPCTDGLNFGVSSCSGGGPKQPSSSSSPSSEAAAAASSTSSTSSASSSSASISSTSSSSSLLGGSSSRSSSISSSSSTKPRRTLLNKVSLLWTAWILFITINTLDYLINLLALCAKCVRTTLTRIKTKWRPWS